MIYIELQILNKKKNTLNEIKLFFIKNNINKLKKKNNWPRYIIV